MPTLHLQGEVLNVSMDKRLNRFILFLIKKKIPRDEKIDKLFLSKPKETEKEKAERQKKERLKELPESHFNALIGMDPWKKRNKDSESDEEEKKKIEQRKGFTGGDNL
jgi:hypothetical protein